MGTIVIDARDDLIAGLSKLEPGSDAVVRQAQAIKMLSEVERDDRKLDFEMEKEETRKLERSNDLVYAKADAELRKIELGIRIIDTILNPGSRLLTTIMNNRTRVKRDIMGYTFETDGVIGSHTLNNAQRDKYD